MQDTLTFLGNFVERYGLGLVMVLWFMFRSEKKMDRLVSKVNRLIVTNAVICRTLDLGDEQEQLISEAVDDGEDDHRRAP